MKHAFYLIETSAEMLDCIRWQSTLECTTITSIINVPSYDEDIRRKEGGGGVLVQHRKPFLFYSTWYRYCNDDDDEQGIDAWRAPFGHGLLK